MSQLTSGHQPETASTGPPAATVVDPVTLPPQAEPPLLEDDLLAVQAAGLSRLTPERVAARERLVGVLLESGTAAVLTKPNGTESR